MALLSSDLTRNFAIGFVLGAMIVGAGFMGENEVSLESPARAATLLEAPQPSGEFLIAPFGED